MLQFMTHIFLEKFMKWKLLLYLSFCLSLLITITTNATTLAPTGSGTTAIEDKHIDFN